MSSAELLWSGPVELSVLPGRVAPPPGLSQRIDELWEAEVQSRPSVVDGTILSVVAVDGNRLAVQRCPYRLFVARERDSELRDALGVRAIGVSGVVVFDGGETHVLVGRRADDVTEYPGAWELVPSGGISPETNPLDALLVELEEEAGLGPEAVERALPLGLVHDVAQDGFDICFRLHIRGAEAVARDEYGELAAIGLGEARRLLDEGPAVPTSRLLLDLAFPAGA